MVWLLVIGYSLFVVFQAGNSDERAPPFPALGLVIPYQLSVSA
jgi:hypothetical protein